jgi:hypothetical protein
MYIQNLIERLKEKRSNPSPLPHKILPLILISYHLHVSTYVQKLKERLKEKKSNSVSSVILTHTP